MQRRKLHLIGSAFLCLTGVSGSAPALGFTEGMATSFEADTSDSVGLGREGTSLSAYAYRTFSV